MKDNVGLNWLRKRLLLRDRRPSTDAYPACLAMVTQALKSCTVRTNIFCTRPTIRAAKEEEKSRTGTKSPPNRPRKDPFLLYSLSPRSSQFQQGSRGHPSLVFLGKGFSYLVDHILNLGLCWVLTRPSHCGMQLLHVQVNTALSV
jgi:hypothetical protein